MKRLAPVVFLLAALLLKGPAAGAQTLPKLSKAPEITTGVLPDKVAWYQVSNGVSKGYADFALVQKGRSDKAGARSALAALPHFGQKGPLGFLSRNGVGYSREGYVSFLPEAVVFHFEDVPVFDSVASDSTLLLIFDLIDTWPGEQAVIISGDVAASKFPDKMKTLSLFVGNRQKSPPAQPYIWNPTEEVLITRSLSPAEELSCVEVSYRFPRTDRELMGTPAPLVTGMFARELGSIVRKRTGAAFRAAGIPMAGFSSSYADASVSGGDENFTIKVYTAASRVREATEELARILGHIDEQGVAIDEYLDARDRLSSEAARDAGNRTVTNSEYVRKCVSAYVYGSHLASAKTVNEFFARRVLTPDHEHVMFNRFCSALLSPSQNLTLGYSLPAGAPEVDSMGEVFSTAWTYSKLDTLDRIKYRVNYGDTLTLPQAGPKVRAWRAVSEPITGGEFWNFSNGIKVICKKTSLKNEFRYGFLIKGGFSGVGGLVPGESAFVGDMLRLYDVAGMNGVDFRNMLRANGIIMEEKVTVSDLRITGSAPTGKLSLLLKSVLAIANERRLNEKPFEYYREGERLRLQASRLDPAGINAVMDSIICPEYIYPDAKYLASLRPDLPERADVYFNRQFRNFSDGMIYFIGDIDPYALKKALCQYLGGFKTGRNRSKRPSVEFPMRTGWSTYTVNGRGAGEPCVNIAMSTLMPFTMDKYASFEIARVAIEKQLVRKLADIGIHAGISEKLDILPIERMTLFVNCWQCPEDGLPEGITPADPLTVLGAVRAAISEVSSAKISAAELKAYKADLTNRVSSYVKSEEYLANAVMVRYSEGKDMISSYKEHIGAVTEASVREILSALEAGSKVEYVIRQP